MAAPSKEVRQAIEAADASFVDAFNRGEPAGIATLYTTDGQILPPNSDPITGHQGIQGFWQAAMDMGLKSVALEIIELEELGDTAVEIGRYTLGDGSGQELDSGKYLITWKQDGEQWKLHRDIWNTSLPPSS